MFNQSERQAALCQSGNFASARRLSPPRAETRARPCGEDQSPLYDQPWTRFPEEPESIMIASARFGRHLILLRSHMQSTSSPAVCRNERKSSRARHQKILRHKINLVDETRRRQARRPQDHGRTTGTAAPVRLFGPRPRPRA